MPFNSAVLRRLCMVGWADRIMYYNQVMQDKHDLRIVVIKEDTVMKISASAIAMSSNRKALSMEQTTVTRSVRMKRGELEASRRKDSGALDLLDDEEDGVFESRAEGAEVTISRQGQQVFSAYQAEQSQQKDMADEYEVALETLRGLLKMLRAIGGSPRAIASLERQIDQQSSLVEMSKKQSQKMNFQMSSMKISGTISSATSGRIGGGTSATQMVSVTQAEHFEADLEYTSFSAAGVAKTEDGRSLSFGIDVEMSREFMNYSKINTEEKRSVLCDPLVINVGSNVASVSDQKFRFDIDADGKEENISQLSPDSGFLALDKNGNGKVDDGSELFGTKSGDGFGDLAAYDKDHNGWIDENDEIFDKLKIWFRDSEGNDRLLNLKEADVGAIYLGKASTQYHLNDEDTNKTNAVIQSTGIYLKESGGVGTLQHVDMAV